VQRCAIARALVHDPDILLFDEPFSGLDPLAADALRELLQAAHAEGRTVLMTSHDLGRGLDLADRVVILRAGRLVVDTPARDLDAEELARRYRAASTGRAT
jgi:ABC-type multidrug transport system ATPase subunit